MNRRSTRELVADIKTGLAERVARQLPADFIRGRGQDGLQMLFILANSRDDLREVARGFLLNCYDARRFPFDLTLLERLPRDSLEDCLAVLMLKVNPVQPLHHYLDNGESLFQQLAAGRLPSS